MQQPMSVWALPGMPEVHEGDDLVAIIVSASAATGLALRDGDILVVTSKIVSKAEGRSRPAAERAQAIDSETVRVVAVRDQTRIVENRLGIVGAAGVRRGTPGQVGEAVETLGRPGHQRQHQHQPRLQRVKIAAAAQAPLQQVDFAPDLAIGP